MQTYRECSRILEVDISEGSWTCANPLIFADVVLVVGDQSGMVLEKAGANKTVSFAGGHGQIAYAAQLCPSDDEMPSNASFRIYSALMVLPLAENSAIAPAVLPNIAQSRSQLSVVFNTQSDSERRILWYRFDRLHWTNIDVTADPTECDLSTTEGSITRMQVISSAAMAQWGRTQGSLFEQFRVKARARMTEREGLFLIRNIVFDPFGNGGSANVVLSVTSDAYLRYAVK